MKNTDTPETDAAEPQIKTTRGGWVRADFARKLERERNELRGKYAMHHAEAERLTQVVRAAWDVVNHWETPLWKNTPPTAEYINKLRNALSLENT